MFRGWIDEVKATPQKLAARRDAVVERARRRARKARGSGEERFFTLRTHTLERVEGWLAKGDELPVVGKLAEKAEQLVHERLEALPIAAYDTLNAKDAIAAIKDLQGRLPLLAVRRFESTHKARKTVLAAIEKALTALDGEADVEAEPVPAA